MKYCVKCGRKWSKSNCGGHSEPIEVSEMDFNRRDFFIYSIATASVIGACGGPDELVADEEHSGSYGCTGSYMCTSSQSSSEGR